MKYRYVKQSGQGLRFDIISSSDRRIATACNEVDAARIVCALNRSEGEFIGSNDANLEGDVK